MRVGVEVSVGVEGWYRGLGLELRVRVEIRVGIEG